MYTYKRLVLITLVLSLAYGISCGKGADSAKPVDVKYYDSGAVKSERFEFEMDKSGAMFKQYYESGALMVTGKLGRHGNAGLWVWYYESGKKRLEEVMKRGNPHGISKLYYESGNLRMETQYLNGLALSQKMFNDNDNSEGVGEVGEAINDLPNKQEETYYDDGSVASKIHLVEGNGFIKHYHEGGNPSMIAKYKNGDLHGMRQFYSEDGTLLYEETNKEGVLTKRKVLGENGNLVTV